MENKERGQVEGKPTWRLAWGLWWRMFLMALGGGAIILMIHFILTFNPSYIGQGTRPTTAQTEMWSVQTAILAGMAEAGATVVTADTITSSDNNKTVYYPETAYQTSGSFQLETYLHLPTLGTWTWDSNGTVVSGTYSGGGKTCIYYYYAPSPWVCTGG